MSSVQPTQSQPARPGRRSFVRALAAGAVATVSGTLAFRGVQSGDPVPPEAAEDESVGMLIDLTRCTGCESCVLACKQANRMPTPEIAGTTLDCENLTCVQACEANCASGPETVFVKRQCMQCKHPACAAACTVGALRKTPEGPVVYDADKCIGCRYCQYACPFGVPTYEWNNPLGLIVKCQMCVSRLNAGEAPACTKACPNGALQFGKREELLGQARARIASNPGRYVDHIYGEEEAGGTAMLYLSPAPFSELGFPTLHGEAPTEAAESVMGKTPLVAVTVASLVTGAHFFFQRRAEVAAYHLHAHEAKNATPDTAAPAAEADAHDEGGPA